jgi:hypothetical protein
MAHQRNYIFYLALSCTFFLNQGCSSTTAKPDDNKNMHLPCQDPTKLKLPEGYKKSKLYSLVFLDYTDPGIMGTNAKQQLKQVMEKFLVSPDDKVEIYFITANTATHQTSPRETFILNIDKCGEFTPYATIDSIKKCQVYACNRLQKLASINAAIDKLLDNQKGTSQTSKFEESDIAGLFAIADRQFNNYANSQVTKNLYIISDLEQNCPGYFDLFNTTFSSKKGIAKGDPDLDFQTISKKVKIANFKGARVMHDLGDIPEQTANSYAQNKMKVYWDKIFQNFGMNQITR